MENTKKIKILGLVVALILIFVGVSLRLLPHPPNFAPIAAIALFAGVYLSWRLAFVLPMVAMVISDVFIGYYEFGLMMAVYGSFLLVVALGFWLKKNKKWHTILGGSLLAAVIFFLLTNFAVWVFSPWYAKTFSGLIYCFVMALPFFKNTLISNLFYVSVFFGIYELSLSLIRRYRYSLNRSTLVQ